LVTTKICGCKGFGELNNMYMHNAIMVQVWRGFMVKYRLFLRLDGSKEV